MGESTWPVGPRILCDVVDILQESLSLLHSPAVTVPFPELPSPGQNAFCRFQLTFPCSFSTQLLSLRVLLPLQ
jgi:hypothetical protein